jgi:uncharacterized protein
VQTAATERVRSLDLIRGVAVLGILAVNIAGFAGPSQATLSPHIPHAGTFADEVSFAAVFVVFEGKMRALFSMLFGASMMLFIERADAAGRFGEVQQLRRLGWLLLFGALHYFLFWWGDILFLYAIAGGIALMMSELPAKSLLRIAAAIFVLWHAAGMAGSVGEALEEERVRLGAASVEEARNHARAEKVLHRKVAKEIGDYRSGFIAQVETKLTEDPLRPVRGAFLSIAETLPLMLLGIVLYRTGFCSGQWARARLVRLAAWGLTLGAVLTLALLALVWPRHFPFRAMYGVILYWAAIPHVLMALGYAALLVMAAPRLLASRLGRGLAKAGRMAFSNYIGTTVAMTAIFYGWGLGLIGTMGHARQLLFVLGAWVVMIVWSNVWLAFFRQGPLEWLWRSLTDGRLLPLRGAAQSGL